MKIVVTGSLGNISKPLTEQLVKQGHSVTVISHSSDRKKAIEELSATAAIGSLDDVPFLTNAFIGADAVYCMVPPNYFIDTTLDPLPYYHKTNTNYVQAIQQSGVKRVVYLSSWGAHLDKGTGFILGSHDGEVVLNKLDDVAVTFLRPGSFYYNLNHLAVMIKHAGIIGANYGGETKVGFAHPADISEAATEELTKTSTGKNIRYVVSDDRTTDDVAAVLGAAISKPDLKWITFTDEQAREGMLRNGLPVNLAEGLVEINAAINSGKLREDYDLHQPATLGKVKLEDYTKEFAAVYNK